MTSMASKAFAALAETRPCIRRDVLFTETPGGVLFHNADGGFHLSGRTAYRFASLLVPHLNGRHTLGEICGNFGPAQQAVAGQLVRTLYGRGFARDTSEEDLEDGPKSAPAAAVERRFAQQIAYIDHYVDGSRKR
ncbi:transcriptional activator protein, partial [Streptomyces chartreusis]